MAVSGAVRVGADARLLRAVFWLTLVGGALAMLVLGVRYAGSVPRTGYGGVVGVSPASVPQVGDAPVYVAGGKFYLVNLAPGEGIPQYFEDVQRSEGRSGLVALHTRSAERCSERRLTWNTEHPLAAQTGAHGLFRTICFHTAYTKAGIGFYGPYYRDMDLLPISRRQDGWIEVDTSSIRR